MIGPYRAVYHPKAMQGGRVHARLSEQWEVQRTGVFPVLSHLHQASETDWELEEEGERQGIRFRLRAVGPVAERDGRDGGPDDGKPIVDLSVDLVDPLIALAAAAARTSTIGFATGIYLLPLRHPLLAARAAATLSNVSGGRFSTG